MPSVIYFAPDGKESDPPVKVGYDAKKKHLIDPARTFSSVKSLMRSEDWRIDPVLKEKFNIDGKGLTPTDIAAEILKKILEDIQTQNDVDLKGQPTQAVICVPANTTDEYRHNVYKAALKAGLGEKNENNETIIDEQGRPRGVTLLDEPTAAAIAYGRTLGIFEGAEKEQSILVYDFGGGTFDVTILKVDSTKSVPVFTPLSTKGVAQLGGDDLDKIIMRLAAEVFKQNSGIDIFDDKSDQKATKGRDLKEAQQKLKERAEEAKIEMANGSSSAQIDIPNFLKDGDGNIYNLEYEIRRSEFLEQIQPILMQATDCVKIALKEANLEMDDINRVILVGGSTKAGWVMDSVETLGKKPYMAENVDVIVSQGAAILGALRPIDESEVKIDIQTKTNHHLGIELENQEFSPMIPAGTSLDKDNLDRKVVKIYGNQEGQDKMQIVVWKTQQYIEYIQKEDGKKQPKEKVFISDKEGKFECIGDFILKGIPKGPRGSQKIEVEMEIQEDNTLKVKAKAENASSEDSVELQIDKI